MTEPTVAKLIRKTLPILRDSPMLGEREKVLSSNRVAGATVNVPIAGTCQPSKLCIRDCYAGNNSQSWPSSLRKQSRTQRTMDSDPVAFAERIIREYDKGGLTYLRWNGVGDLTPSAVVAINHIIATRPDITLWIVTRIPALAAQVAHGDNAHVHFSLDKTSLDRKDAFLANAPKSQNYFFSYQCEKNEVPPSGATLGVSVIFYKRYTPTTGSDLSDPAVCPLNTLTDCTGACNSCRRCFNGDAEAMRLGYEAGSP